LKRQRAERIVDTDDRQAEIDLLKNLNVSNERHSGCEHRKRVGLGNADRLIA
jgi:hypothetical protein